MGGEEMKLIAGYIGKVKDFKIIEIKEECLEKKKKRPFQRQLKRSTNKNITNIIISCLEGFRQCLL